MKKQPSQEAQYWVREEHENGMVTMVVPMSVKIDPAHGSVAEARRRASYLTDDRMFGKGSVVCISNHPSYGTEVQEVYMNVPPEVMEMLLSNDDAESSSQRKDNENCVYGNLDSSVDENGDYHCGVFDMVSYNAWDRENRNQEEEEPLDESQLIAPFSDNYRIRNQQVRFMTGIIERAIYLLPPKNQNAYYMLYGQCMKGVDIADEWGVGKSAISNHNDRIIDKIGDVFREMGFQVPTKAELKAEKKAAEKRMEEIRRQQKEQHEDRLEIRLLRGVANVFYEEGMLDDEQYDFIEQGLDEAA